MAQNEDPGIGIPPLLSSALLKPTWALALTFHKKLFYERNKGHRYSTERSKGPEHGAPGGRSRLFSASPPPKKKNSSRSMSLPVARLTSASLQSDSSLKAPQPSADRPIL